MVIDDKKNLAAIFPWVIWNCLEIGTQISPVLYWDKHIRFPNPLHMGFETTGIYALPWEREEKKGEFALFKVLTDI